MVRSLLPRQLSTLLGLPAQVEKLRKDVDDLRMLAAGPMAHLARTAPAGTPLKDVEFKVYSQFGDDGILQHLIHHVAPSHTTFVEFGVEDYTESNTRFLLRHDNWRGLVIDGSPEHIETIRRDRIHVFHDLNAVRAFIDRDNIDGLIRGAGFEGPVGLLSVDIDGNDYWVWEAIRSIEPDIVVCEYNNLFGISRPVSVPYDARFVREEKHSSYLYFGASLTAMCHLADKKGYAFVGSNSVGLNAFFVRRERLGKLRELDPRDDYRLSRIRESRDAQGRMSFAVGLAGRRLIDGMPLVDVTTGERLRVADLGDDLRRCSRPARGCAFGAPRSPHRSAIPC